MMHFNKRLRAVVTGLIIWSATLGTANAAEPAPAALPHETSVSTSILDEHPLQLYRRHTDLL
jgi:hypothetical protein